MLTRLKIDFKKHARAGTLSGGQKRKLSLAIALCGGSEVRLVAKVKDNRSETMPRRNEAS